MKNSTKLLSFFLLISLLSFSNVVLAAKTNGGGSNAPKPTNRGKKVEPVQPVRVQDPSHYTGVVTAVAVTENTFTISIKDNKKPVDKKAKNKIETKTFIVDEKTIINKDSLKINIKDLKQGDDVNVVLERIGKDNFRVRSVRVITVQTLEKVKTLKTQNPSKISNPTKVPKTPVTPKVPKTPKVKI